MTKPKARPAHAPHARGPLTAADVLEILRNKGGAVSLSRIARGRMAPNAIRAIVDDLAARGAVTRVPTGGRRPGVRVVLGKVPVRGPKAPRERQRRTAKPRWKPAPIAKPAPPSPGASYGSFTERDLLAIRPDLLKFANALCRNTDLAQDLVQETLLRALANAHQFRAGTSLQAWAFTILRNYWWTVARKSGRVICDSEIADALEHQLWVPPVGTSRMELAEALDGLEPMYRDALLDIGSGYSYDESAERADVPAGTLKSRVFRARQMLEGADTPPQPGEVEVDLPPPEDAPIATARRRKRPQPPLNAADVLALLARKGGLMRLAHLSEYAARREQSQRRLYTLIESLRHAGHVKVMRHTNGRPGCFIRLTAAETVAQIATRTEGEPMTRVAASACV